MVRGSVTGPSPFFVLTAADPDHPASVVSVHKYGLRVGESLKIFQLCLKLKKTILIPSNYFYGYGTITDL